MERASAIDLMELASATTPAAGQVGGVLVFAPVPRLDLDIVRSALAHRIGGVQDSASRFGACRSGAEGPSGSTTPRSTSPTT
jgi:hypothetical protein